MAVTVTDAAAEFIRKSLESRADCVGLRLGVKSSGCSGFGYEVDFADTVGEDDSVFEDRGVKVVVDNRSLAFVDGTEIDFGREGLNEGLRFNNPNITSQCGCGESFTTQ